MRLAGSLGLAFMIALVGSGCASSEGSSSQPANDGGGGNGGGQTDGGGNGGDGGSSKDAATDGAGGDAGAANGDPSLDGPFAFASRDATTRVTATGHDVAIHVVYPTSAGLYPVVVMGHGFQLPPSQYYGYLDRLASFGYVAMTVDYPAPLSGSNNPDQAKDLLAGIDWAKADAALGGKVDDTKVATTGHSLGGKVALLAATMDPRVKASIALDPVDAGGPSGCNAPACVNVASLLPGLSVPTGFLGETTDATGAFQACAPAASNFTTFYAQAKTPSLSVTVLGANHMSFLDDVSKCGFTCSLCNAATAKNADVNALARAFVVAFVQRHVRGIASYDSYLTGADAVARYVTTNRATIASK